jgi:hypothetical protein
MLKLPITAQLRARVSMDDPTSSSSMKKTGNYPKQYA